jgi:hypothetical protein
VRAGWVLARARAAGKPRPNMFAPRALDARRFAAAAEAAGAVEPDAVRVNEMGTEAEADHESVKGAGEPNAP